MPDGQSVGVLTGEGFSTIVAGQKVRWVLEMMNGPEFAGERIGHYDMTRARTTGRWSWSSGAPPPGEPNIDLTELGRARAPRRRRPDVPLPGHGGAGAGGDLRRRRRARLRLAQSHGRRRGRPATAVAARAVARQRASPRRGRRRRHLRSHDVRRPRRCAASDDSWTAATAATRTTTPRPPRICSSTIPRASTSPRIESGPVRARVRIERDVPVADARHRRRAFVLDAPTRPRRPSVVTTLELRTGERFLRVHTELDNPCRDHRLRAHFPLPAPVTGSHAECARRRRPGLTAEGGPNEFGLPTFVSRRFVDASDGSAGLALVHDGLLEYELLTDDGKQSGELALTLLRATGYLSRLQLSMRASPAGYPYPLEGPQMLGRRSFDYALLPHRGDWRCKPLRRRRRGARPARASPSRRGEGRVGSPAARLQVDGARVAAEREPGGLLARVFNPSPIRRRPPSSRTGRR